MTEVLRFERQTEDKRLWLVYRNKKVLGSVHPSRDSLRGRRRHVKQPLPPIELVMDFHADAMVSFKELCVIAEFLASHDGYTFCEAPMRRIPQEGSG